MADVKQFKLPDVGEGLTEAEIISWKVKPGDAVKVNDVIVEIETAKSLVELPSPWAGVISELFVPEGETIAVGTVIIAVDTDPSGAAPASGSAPAADAAAGGSGGSGASESDLTPPVSSPADGEPVEPGLIGGPAPGGRTSVLVGYGPRETSAKRRPRKGAAVPEGASAEAAQQGVQAAITPEPDQVTPPPLAESPVNEATPTEAGPVGAESRETESPEGASADGSVAIDGSGGRAGRPGSVLAKPPVRKLAKDLGVDLSALTASGPNGTVTRADVEAAAAGTPADAGDSAADSQAAGRPSADAREREVRIPVKGVRKMTAQAMVTSAFTAPHVTEFHTVDVTRTVKLVERLRTHRDFRDARLSPMLVLARAMIIAIRRTPEINATWDEAAQEIVQKRYVNLGIAAATPRGLIVPNIKDADQLSLRELADAVSALVSTARDGRTPPADMAQGTITITNVGVFGVDTGTPIINPGESAIMAFGAIRPQPWVVRGKVRPRMVTTLAVSFDHRVVDGEQGSRFLADVAAILEDPALALALA